MKPSCLILYALISTLFCQCVTTGVKRAITLSDAAMIAPYIPELYLNEAGQSSSSLKAMRISAVSKLNTLIDENSENSELVNHLQLRKAMLLTQHQQKEDATQAWGAIKDVDSLKSDRDKALYQSREALLSLYSNSSKSPSSDQRKALAKNLEKLSKAVSEIKSKSGQQTRRFLAYNRASGDLKMRGKWKEGTPARYIVNLTFGLAELYAEHKPETLAILVDDRPSARGEVYYLRLYKEKFHSAINSIQPTKEIKLVKADDGTGFKLILKKKNSNSHLKVISFQETNSTGQYIPEVKDRDSKWKRLEMNWRSQQF